MSLDPPGEFTLVELDLTDDALASQVHGVMLRSYRVEAALIGTDDIPALHETVDRMRAQPLRWLGVVTPDSTVAAFVAWKSVVDENDVSVLDLDRVCVDPPWFRRGFARAALRRAIDRSKAARITVSTGEANAPAVGLYESLGFEQTGVIEPVPELRVVEFSLETGN